MKKFMFFALFALLAAACSGGSSDSFNAKKSAYGDPTVTSVAAINVGMLTNEKKLHVLGRAGTTEFSGRVFDVIDVKINDNSEAEMLFSPFPVTKETKKIFFGGYTSKSGEGIKPKEAVEVDLPKLGETTEGSGEFTVKLPGMPIEVDVPLDWTVKLEEEDVSINTPSGSYSGLRHYTGSGKISEGPLGDFLGNTEFTGDIYFSPTLGIPVQYKLNGVNFEGDLESVWDYGDPDETGYRVMKKSGIVNSENPSFELSTYELKGNFDADPNQHAKMLLEIRYLDESAAKNDPQPEINVEFGTVMGYFPSQLVESPVSIFFPEENEGFRYFIAYVSQAAKGHNGPISYRISVTGGESVKPLRVTARIYYNKVE
ncbi:hypothetical protein II898_04090 [bacterium]|nr:hypothetical protein [bacterium]